jgi:hypothetical protein
MELKELILERCAINDEGLQALVEGVADCCEVLNLNENESITASGLRYLSNSMRSESCRLVELHLFGIDIDAGAEVLARGLVGNKSLKYLWFDFDLDRGLAWPAFRTALCDTSNVNNTYLSNHTLHEFLPDDTWYYPEELSDLIILQALNREHPQHAARCKILMSHPHIDMLPFLQWKLKFLPLAIAWFERARPCTTLSILDNDPELRRLILEESDEAFQSRVLTALYEFVRGMPKKVLERREELILVAAYDDKIARIEEDSKRLREELEQKITQLEEEKEMLSGIVEAVRNSVGV